MRLDPPIPVLRTFDWALAQRFYVDWLGFAVDWEHVRAPTALDMRRSRAGPSCST